MYVCLGMVMGRGGVEGWDLRPAPAPHGFFFPHPRPTPHDGKNFLALFSPLEALQSPAPSRKTLVFVNLPKGIIIFLIKHISLIKIYLKLLINLSHQIKLIFSKY